MSLLPAELLNNIFVKLPPQDFLQACQLSKSVREMLNSERTWTSVLSRHEDIVGEMRVQNRMSPEEEIIATGEEQPLRPPCT